MSAAARADREWEEQCGDLARLATDWLWEMDADLRISYLSGRLRWIMDIDPSFFIGKRRDQYVDAETGDDYLETHLADLRAHRPIRNYVYDVETPSGRRYVKIDGDPMFDDKGNFLGYRGIGTQVTSQVRAEQKAERSFRQFVDAVESLPVGLAQYDKDDKLQFWNSAYARLYPWLDGLLDYGITYPQVIRHLADTGGLSANILDREAWVEANLAARASGQRPFDIELSDSRWIRVLHFRVRHGGTISIHTDITQLKSEEDARLQSEQRFARAFQFSPGATAIAEIDDGTLIDVNEKWQQTFGWTRDEVIGKSALELGLWANQSDRRQFIDMLRTNGRVRNFEARQCDRQGNVRAMLVSGEVVPLEGRQRLLISGHDITERERAERELRNSEARLSGILRISPEAVIVTDGDQRITLFNEGAERIFGYRASEVLGKPIDILIPADSRLRHREHVARFRVSPVTSKFMGKRQEITALAKDGAVFPAEASISKLELHGETVFTVLLHDITERKQAEATLLAAKDEAESASRAKSEFLANMSHELRTPLNAILGFSEVIRTQVLGQVGVAKYLEYADDIHRSGEHLLDIISDILDVARIDAGQVSLEEEAVSIDDLILSSLMLVRDRAAERRILVTTEFAAGLRPVVCDRRKMKQVVINLLSNATKFTCDGGQIRVAAWVEENTGDMVIEVRDNGIGMATEDIPRVMEPFTQLGSSLTREYEGTGLGLPLVRKLTELHDGSIEMESALGEGTAVRVRLPASRLALADVQGSLFRI